jgi:hypothetical protein
MSWLSNYKYRKQFSVSRASGAVTDYQMKLELGQNSNCFRDDVGFMQHWYTQPYTTYLTTVNSVSNSVLRVTSTGADPHIQMYSLGSFNPNVYNRIVIRYRVVSGTSNYMEIYFLNARRTTPNGDQGFNCPINIDGGWHTLVVNCSAHQYWTNSNITGWRLDYTNATGNTVELDYVGLVSLVDINCNNHCLESFNDLRFTNSNGNVLNYWVDKVYGEYPNLTATVWVKFDSIGTTDTNFYMYYGNPGANSDSSGSNTFIAFEDFEWGSNGMDLTTSSGSVTWVRAGSTPATISTEKYYKGTRSGKLIGATSYTNYYFTKTGVTLTDNIAFSLWFYKETDVPNGPNIGIGGTKYAGFWVNATEDITDAASVDTGLNISPDMWQKVECYNMNISTGKYDIKVNNSSIKTSASMGTGSASFRFLNASTTVGHDVWGDEIIVRHYRSVEPVVGSFNSEEEFTPLGKISWDRYVYKGFEAKKIYLGNYLVYEQTTSMTVLDAPALWLDASDSSTLSMSGSDVAQWSDKSLNGYHATSSTYRPSLYPLGGKNTVYFNSGEGLMHTSAKSMLRNKSAAIMAFVFNTTPSLDYRFMFTHRGQLNTPYQLRFQLATPYNVNKYRITSQRLDADTVVAGVNTSFDVDSNYHISIAYCFWETGKLYFYFDGAYVGEANYESSGNTSDTDLQTTTDPWQSIGAAHFSTSYTYSSLGGIGEIIVLTKSSGVYDFGWGTILEGYLAHKWGLANKLPNTHAFKLGSPAWKFQS